MPTTIEQALPKLETLKKNPEYDTKTLRKIIDVLQTFGQKQEHNPVNLKNISERYSTRLKFTSQLDKIASEIETTHPLLALTLDTISDHLEANETIKDTLADHLTKMGFKKDPKNHVYSTTTKNQNEEIGRAHV